jgi:uncharacterized protein YcaQ
VIELSAAEARLLLLSRQGLGAAAPRGGSATDRVTAMLRRLGAVQLDTISVLARSHELVAYSRLGAVGRDAVEGAYWGRPPRAFEYWAHAACILPLEEWPWFEARRRRNRARREQRPRSTEATRGEVLARLADLGPVTTADLGGAKNGAGVWWDWSPLKRAVEELLAGGEVVCVERRGWRRVYELTDRVVPEELRIRAPVDDVECAAHLAGLAAERIGVGTLADLADYFRLPPADARAGVEAAGLTPVAVEGWPQPAWAPPSALAAPPPPARFRPVLLSPFDSLLWDRRRAERTLGFVHRLEAYVPAALRQHGYFVMPLLAGGRIRGRVDVARRGRTLVARRVSVEPAAVRAMARALVEAAGWVGCDAVGVEEVLPAGLAAPLRAEVVAAGG